MISFFTTIFFILGIIIGSFLNVVIYRFHTRKVLGGRSACMSCQNKLHFYELIPLISFFVLRGRCRVCKTKISKMYPIVEFITGLIFLGLFLKFQDILFLNLPVFIFTYVYYAIVLSLLIVIAFYDLRHKIIPDALSIAFGLLSFLGLFFFNEYGFSIHILTVLQFFSGLSKKGSSSEFLKQYSLGEAIKIIIRAYWDAVKKIFIFWKKRVIIMKNKKIGRMAFYRLLKNHKLGFGELVFKK